MAWIQSQKRLTQCYIATAAALNDCGIRPDGAEIKPWIRDELTQVSPPVTEVEADLILGMMWTEGVKFENTNPNASTEKFDAHPWFGARGHKLGVKVPGA
jgi:hypothetical protein